MSSVTLLERPITQGQPCEPCMKTHMSTCERGGVDSGTNTRVSTPRPAPLFLSSCPGPGPRRPSTNRVSLMVGETQKGKEASAGTPTPFSVLQQYYAAQLFETGDFLHLFFLRQKEPSALRDDSMGWSFRRPRSQYIHVLCPY